MKKSRLSLFALYLFMAGCTSSQPAEEAVTAGNPVIDGWYADPEGIFYGDTYWIYPTYSAPYEEQVFMDAFSSPNLLHWTKHERIIDTTEVRYARKRCRNSTRLRVIMPDYMGSGRHFHPASASLQ